MTTTDIRWIQRLSNFTKALIQIRAAIELANERALSNLEQQGLVQAFEYTHELAWKTLKDFLENKGNQNIYGSKDATRAAFKLGLIQNGEIWMDMIQSRNQTSHSYDEKTVEEIIKAIQEDYFDEFETLQKTLNQLKEKQ